MSSFGRCFRFQPPLSITDPYNGSTCTKTTAFQQQRVSITKPQHPGCG